MLDSENTKKSKEVEDLQARVAEDEQRDEDARRESFGLKQKIVATEASKEQALKEVQLFFVCERCDFQKTNDLVILCSLSSANFS